MAPAGDEGFSTYATLMVKAGSAPANQPLEMPIVLKPYRHENRQFGYLPKYPVESQVYFDTRNRPYVRTEEGVATLDGDQWKEFPWNGAAGGKGHSGERQFRMTSTKLAFDRDNDLYALAMAGPTAVLLRSSDRGKTVKAHAIPGREGRSRTFDIEQFSGNNQAGYPPPVLRYTRTARDPNLIWRRINDLELFLPEKKDDRLELGEPILMTKKCIGLSAHSGIPSSVVSRGDKVHVAWGEATAPRAKVEGVPSYVATYDRRTRKLGEPVLIGYGPPPNDVHNSPSITMDAQGYLHVLAGTHGRPFPYSRSLKPNDAYGGWTEAEPMGQDLRQTYIGLVADQNNTLHAVFRLWQIGKEPFPHSSYGTLAYQRKRPGTPWEPPRILVMAPFSEYSIFYHRLTIDRDGSLFLSYDYWSTFWFYRNDHYGRRRALLTSPDGGETWKLAGQTAWHD